MVLRKPRISVQDDSMSDAFAIAQSLERRERSRVSSVTAARRALASKLRIGVGTFENLVRERVKSVDASIRDRLHTLLVAELQNEIKRLSHELEMVQASRSPVAIEQMGEIEAHLAKARALLNGGDDVPA